MTLEKYLQDLQGKRVAVIGIGVSNTPLIRLLRGAGIDVTACDRKERDALGDIAGELEALGCKLQLGADYLSALDHDVIFRTPGLSPNHPALQEAAQRGRTNLYRLVKQNNYAVLMLLEDSVWNPVEGMTLKLTLEQFNETTVDAQVLSFTRSGGELLLRLAVIGDVSDVLYMRTCTAQLGEYVDCLKLPVKAIIFDTWTGRTGRYLAEFRPKVPIYAMCYNSFTMRELALTYDIYGYKFEITGTKEGFVQNSLNILLKDGKISKGDLVGFIGGSFNDELGATYMEFKYV